jgi:ubiquinone/menaquinone biosynthesis C-methylase UbiE
VSRDRYRCTFEAVVETYERSRPLYADDAVAWAAQRLPFGRVLDLGAGTGKLTRQLLAHGAAVVAVEPGDEMRRMLERVVPGAESLAGSAEAIPLPDESVDAVVVGQAFHWFRTTEALDEMYRVLRPGGGYALLWNEWNAEVPLMRSLNELVDNLRPDLNQRDERPEWWPELERSPRFGALEERAFHHAERLSVDMIVDRIRSVSAFIVATGKEQQRVEAEVRALLGEEADFPMITTVVVADRV